MVRTLIFTATFVVVALPALAGQRCNQPYPPEIRFNATTSNEQMLSMRDDTQAFIAASDIYQACVLKNLASDVAQSAIRENQRDKERIGKAYNDGVAALKTRAANLADASPRR